MSASTKTSHPSNSEPQKQAENEMRGKLEKQLGCDLCPKTIPSSTGKSVQIDGCSESARVLCEIYAHIGVLKGSQPSKPLADAIKMALAEKWLGGNWRKVFAFADAEAADKFQTGSWQGEAMKFLGVEITTVPLENRTKRLVLKAQARQNMRSAPE